MPLNQSKKRKVYLPLLMDITDKKVLLIGAGKACAEKLRTLSQLSIPVTVIAPHIDQAFLNKEWITIEKRSYKAGDLKGYDIVYVGVNNPELEDEIEKEVIRENCIVNYVDRPARSDFISPSLIQKEHFSIFISTFGEGPGATKAIRKTIEETLDLEKLDEFTGDYKRKRNR